jgi:hypothetical protein
MPPPRYQVVDDEKDYGTFVFEETGYTALGGNPTPASKGTIYAALDENLTQVINQCSGSTEYQF